MGFRYRNKPLIYFRSNWTSLLGASLATTVAGSTSDPGPWAYQFSSPTAISMDRYGYIYVLDTNNDRVQRWVPGATFGDTAVSTSLAVPLGMKLDPVGNIIISDTNSHRVISFNMVCRKYFSK